MIESHDRWMARAIELSKRGFPAPNPHVGCVIVKAGEIVGEGFHMHAGAPHAEAVALEMAGNRAVGSDVYVTLEPCTHTGRTPPCADALISAKVSRVFFAVDDPDPKAMGGAPRLRNAGVKVESGLLAEQAEEANWVFLTSVRRRRPVVCVKAAVTVDGFMARLDGTSQWITGPRARKVGHRLRAEMGAVLVGCGTVIADDPKLTARIPGVVNQPTRAVLDPHVRLTGSESLFHQPGQTIWVVARGKETDSRQTGVDIGNGFDLPGLLDFLYEAGCRGVLVEGGPRTIRRFFDAHMVDRLELFVGAKVFGSGMPLSLPCSEGTDLNLLRVQRLGQDVRMAYQIREKLNIV